MLAALGDRDARTRDFAARALAEISGEDHGDNIAAWRKWWEREKAGHADDGAID